MSYLGIVYKATRDRGLKALRRSFVLTTCIFFSPTSTACRSKSTSTTFCLNEKRPAPHQVLLTIRTRPTQRHTLKLSIARLLHLVSLFKSTIEQYYKDNLMCFITESHGTATILAPASFYFDLVNS